MEIQEIRRQAQGELEETVRDFMNSDIGQELREVIKCVNFKVDVQVANHLVQCIQVIETVGFMFKSGAEQDKIFKHSGIIFDDDDKTELLFEVLGEVHGQGIMVNYMGETLEYWVYTNVKLRIVG